VTVPIFSRGRERADRGRPLIGQFSRQGLHHSRRRSRIQTRSKPRTSQQKSKLSEPRSPRRIHLDASKLRRWFPFRRSTSASCKVAAARRLSPKDGSLCLASDIRNCSLSCGVWVETATSACRVCPWAIVSTSFGTTRIQLPTLTSVFRGKRGPGRCEKMLGQSGRVRAARPDRGPPRLFPC
jgi:hypothetical protein